MPGILGNQLEQIGEWERLEIGGHGGQFPAIRANKMGAL